MVLSKVLHGLVPGLSDHRRDSIYPHLQVNINKSRLYDIGGGELGRMDGGLITHRASHNQAV